MHKEFKNAAGAYYYEVKQETERHLKGPGSGDLNFSATADFTRKRKNIS